LIPEAHARESLDVLLQVVDWGVQGLKHARIVAAVNSQLSFIREVEIEVDDNL
jgi:hypothetical protein